jgi:Dolichyl-phosphate-mannose-protein mannosyltransferase
MKNRVFFASMGIFLLAFAFRFSGLLDNHPFWVDEFSSANQARLILSHGLSYFTNTGINVEHNNYTHHVLVAFFFTIFGQHEWVARLPAVIIGSLVSVAVLFLGRYLYDFRVGLLAAILTTTSYFQIAWSRQARGYMLQELLSIIAFIIYMQIISRKKCSKRIYLALIVVSILGILTHFSYWLLLGTFFIHFLLLKRKNVLTLAKSRYFYIALGVVSVIAYTLGVVQPIVTHFSTGLMKANNIWYYHSFLWREYALISYLGIVGGLMALAKKPLKTSILALYLLIHLFFFTFMFEPYVTRYLLVIFPLLLVFVAYALSVLAESFISPFELKFPTKHVQTCVSFLFVGIIILNGYKFDVKPNRFYSINHDFREVALIDYNQIYSIITSKGNLREGKTAVIDTWHDRLYWYLGTDFYAPYMFRWGEFTGNTTNGLKQQTIYTTNKEGEKLIPREERLILVSELGDLEKVMKKYERGFIIIDDTTMPAEIINYANKNFKKELYLDHYPLDDNPYSIWPATLYSWGIQ